MVYCTYRFRVSSFIHARAHSDEMLVSCDDLDWSSYLNFGDNGDADLEGQEHLQT